MVFIDLIFRSFSYSLLTHNMLLTYDRHSISVAQMTCSFLSSKCFCTWLQLQVLLITSLIWNFYVHVQVYWISITVCISIYEFIVWIFLYFYLVFPPLPVEIRVVKRYVNILIYICVCVNLNNTIPYFTEEWLDHIFWQYNVINSVIHIILKCILQ